MDLSGFSDLNLVNALTNASSGIIGAMLGAWVAYLAAKNQYITEYRYKKWDALRAVLIELCLNQASLYRDLDRLLPIWLPRAHRRGGVSRDELADLISQTASFRRQSIAGYSPSLSRQNLGQS